MLSAAIGMLSLSKTLVVRYLFIICAIAAWYTASALMLNDSFSREMQSLARSSQAQKMPTIAAGMG